MFWRQGRKHDAVFGSLNGVASTRIVELRLAYHAEAYLAPDRLRPPHDRMSVAGLRNRHKVENFGNAILGEETRK
jgi:hypothetical protein